jgi:hypothetical protein
MKRTFKTILTLALVCLMLTALAIPVTADIIYEPNNLFYVTHSKDCEYLRVRHYLANTEAGYAYLYQSPDNPMTVRAYPNGEEVAITWLYTASDGAQWGMIGDESGWICLADWSLVYDSREFLKDHETECVPFEGESAAEIPATEEKPVIAWSYPGGDRAKYTLSSGNVAYFVGQTYTDANGTVWGHIGYMYGMRDFWVCLSNPYDESVGGYALPDHEITLKQEPVAADDIPVSDGNKVMLIAVGVLIVGVVIGTTVIIRVAFVKKNKQ